METDSSLRCLAYGVTAPLHVDLEREVLERFHGSHVYPQPEYEPLLMSAA